MAIKEELPIADAPQRQQHSRSKRLQTALLLLLPLLAFGFFSGTINLPSLPSLHHCSHASPRYTSSDLAQAKCPAQPKALNVGSNWDPLTDEAFSQLAATRLSKAIQINTESFDDLPLDPTDPIFDKHKKFSEYIEKEFPKLYSDPITHEYVNTHGHLFTWKGRNPDLKPIVLMAHIDTVPVLHATLDQWTYPPFEGKVVVNATEDTPGTWIWGRGASDCKNQLLGIYNAVEKLLDEGYEPERTILIANGFDEEIGGKRGAEAIAKRIEEVYGADSVAFLVDEGFSGVSTEYGATFASIGMAEKGAVNVEMKVEAVGGHSSVPPAHTAIGVTALLLAELEAKPFEPVLDPRGPYLKYLNCLSDYAPDLPKKIKHGVKNPKQWKKLAHELASADRQINSFLATTQAIDLINGGVKVNALPEVVKSTINHRISFTSNVNETLEHIKKVISPVVHKLNYTLAAFGEQPSTSSPYKVTLTAFAYFESAPITSPEDASFPLLAGTIKTIFGDDVVVAPTGMYANTDTRRFWNLTQNLYRLTPARVTDSANVHTVNERMSLKGHLTTTRFFYKLIRNSEGWKD